MNHDKAWLELNARFPPPTSILIRRMIDKCNDTSKLKRLMELEDMYIKKEAGK